MIEKLKTVIPALVTPLKEDGSFDAEGMKRLVGYVQGKGLTHLFVLGYAGECLSFDREMRKAAIRTVRESSAPGTVIIAGVMDDSTELITAHIRDAKESGADIALTTPTNFYHLTTEEQKGLFLRLADQSPLPILIYNCPENQHYIEPDCMNALAAHPNIIALKETSNVDKMQRMLLGLDQKNDFLVMSGEEFIYYPSLALGVEGFIMGGPGNMIPTQCLQIREDFLAGRQDAARDGYMRMISFLYDLYFSLPYPSLTPQIKAVLELFGICGRWMAHPMTSVSDGDMEKIREILKKHGVEK
ncbi:dihydrodipicolinate synthase family protein [Anaerotruncus massiliensis (ex Togo et al. 2019)]|uniref:dihydrodipicolinate synthase family protein n=1 Tax=Anaerotruncus massiliensis (ex Togo et al. 2019) TaxID=1673720 RepID=UPI0027BA529B|nr:dihydrodipicolinate synthase family protein [Anaerotruncus massiliensis (ex Togo et al. 2019)]